MDLFKPNVVAWFLKPAACGLLLASMSATVHAFPLGLNASGPGDITAGRTYVNYTLDVGNPNTGTLTVTGLPSLFDVNMQNILKPRSFNLSLSIDRNTGAIGPLGGSMTIIGETNGTPHYGPGTLLSGTITQFGFVGGPFLVDPSEGNIFEFIVHTTGGLLEADYYASHTAGIILNMNGTGPSWFAGVFTSAFNNGGPVGFSDTFPTPVPSSLVLLVSICGPLALWRCYQGRRRTDRV